MKLRTEILFYLKGLFILCSLLFFMLGCLERNPKRKKELEIPILGDSVAYNEFQGKFISQKRINDSTYEIKAKANDTAKTIVFLSELPVRERVLNQYDSNTLILKYHTEKDSVNKKIIFRVKSVEIFSISNKEKSHE